MVSNNKYLSTRVNSDGIFFIAERIKIALRSESKELSGKTIHDLEMLSNYLVSIVNELTVQKLKTFEEDDLNRALLNSQELHRNIAIYLNKIDSNIRTLIGMTSEFEARSFIVQKTIDEFFPRKPNRKLEIGGIWPAIEEK